MQVRAVWNSGWVGGRVRAVAGELPGTILPGGSIRPQDRTVQSLERSNARTGVARGPGHPPSMPPFRTCTFNPGVHRHPQDLAGLQAAGRVVAATLREVRRLVRPGVTTAELDARGRADLRPPRRPLGAAARLRLPGRDLHQRRRRGRARHPRRRAGCARAAGQARRHRRARRLLRRRRDLGARRAGRGRASRRLVATAAAGAAPGPRGRPRRARRCRRSAAPSQAEVERRGFRVCASSPATASAARSTSRRACPTLARRRRSR